VNQDQRGKFVQFDFARFRDFVAAFEDARGALPEQPPSKDAEEILARRMTDQARRGQWDRRSLCDDALAHFGALRRVTPRPPLVDPSKR